MITDKIKSANILNDADLIDLGLDSPKDSAFFHLASRVDSLDIIYRSGNNKGLFLIDKDLEAKAEDANSTELNDQIHELENQVGSLERQLEDLDLDRLIIGVKRAKEAVEAAKTKVDFILGLGGDQ